MLSQLVNVGEEVLVFYSDPQSFNCLVDMMQSERERLDEAGPLLYHINLVELLACCTEGKNVYTEIKCHSLLPLDDIVRVVTHPDCIPEVRWTGLCGACSTDDANIRHSALGLLRKENITSYSCDRFKYWEFIRHLMKYIKHERPCLTTCKHR